MADRKKGMEIGMAEYANIIVDIYQGKLDRLILAERNVKVIGEIMTEVTKYTKNTPFIMITNPLDVTTYLAANKFGYEKGKLFGTGTTLETLRLKRIIANHYNVDAKDVQGFCCSCIWRHNSLRKCAGKLYTEACGY